MTISHENQFLGFFLSGRLIKTGLLYSTTDPAKVDTLHNIIPNLYFLLITSNVTMIFSNNIVENEHLYYPQVYCKTEEIIIKNNIDSNNICIQYFLLNIFAKENITGVTILKIPLRNNLQVIMLYLAGAPSSIAHRY